MKKYKRRKAMRVLWLCLAALVLCVAVSLGSFLIERPTPQDVSIPGQRGEIPATILLPGKLSRGSEMPLVILCHGFTGNRNGDGHFAPLAQDLADQGIASVRLDFAGCGESTEPYTNYTLANMAADVDAAIAYMQDTYHTQGPIALVGHSMGGRLASLYPQLGSYPVEALVLWSPANGTGLQGLEFLNIEDFSQVEAVAGEAKAFFVRKSGEQLYRGIVDKIVKRNLSKVATVQKKSPHVLRHTFATQMLNHDAQLGSIKELLGHESLATTEVYTHTTFEELKRMYNQAHPRA